MRNTTKPKSLVRSLTWTYIFYPLLVLGLGLLLYLTLRSVNGQEDSLGQQLQTDAQQLAAGAPVQTVLPKGTAAAVLTADGQLLDSMTGKGKSRLRPAELAALQVGSAGFVSEGTANVYMAEAFRDKEGRQRYLIEGFRYLEQPLLSDLLAMNIGETSSQQRFFAVLDADFRVLSSSFLKEGTDLSGLTQQLLQEETLIQHAFQTEKEGGKTLFYLSGSYTPADSRKDLVNMALLLGSFILCYVILALLLAFWNRRKVQRPIIRLSQAIGGLADRRSQTPLDYQGPAEFIQIVDSFNQVSAQLRQSEEETQALQAERQQMLADISHDLKTPITVIQGYAKAVRDGMVTGQRQEHYLNTIYQKSQRVSSLIDDFHDFSKIDHPVFALTLETLDLREFVAAYFRQQAEAFAWENRRLVLDLPEDPVCCAVDRQQFERILDNLLANFLKHAGPGSTLSIQLQEQNGRACLLIADDGPGIPPEQGQKLFRPFVTGEAARSSQSGSGLGLAIVRSLVRRHGGNIQLELPPRPPYRTVFLISLPLTDEA